MNTEPTIGIITALPKEYTAVRAVVENPHEVKVLGNRAVRNYLLAELPSAENNIHNIVLLLADMGNNIAAATTTLLLELFPSIQYVIMVGIAGGVPNPDKPDIHVRLGDIVVSNKLGVIQYDFDKESVDEVVYRHKPIPSSARLLEGVKMLEAATLEGGRPWMETIMAAGQKLGISRPPEHTDILVSATDPKSHIEHPPDPKRSIGEPRIFSGPIASGNKLLKNPLKRDLLHQEFGVLAIEMEGAGVGDAAWNSEVGYLVIRGICDYCDSNKNDKWQNYAALAAAAYMRVLLQTLPRFDKPQRLPTLDPAVYTLEPLIIPHQSSDVAKLPKSVITSFLARKNKQQPQVLSILENILLEQKRIPSYVLEYLFPYGERLFGPSGKCALWWLVQNGNYHQLFRIAQLITNQVGKQVKIKEYEDPYYRSFLAAIVLSSLTECQRGHSTRSLSLLNYVQGALNLLGIHELVAWAFNIRSIVMGKLGNESQADIFAQRAAWIAEKYGDYWLSASIQIRMLHRADWHAWETGKSLDDDRFETVLNSIMASVTDEHAEAFVHIDALSTAAQTLHFSWKPEDSTRALNMAERSLILLTSHTDHDEAARVISEIGRINLKSLNNPLESIRYLKQSAPLRLESGNLARLRYDLSWLAEAYIAIGNEYEAGLCAHLALILHENLYGEQSTDSKLVKRLQLILSSLEPMRNVIYNREMLYANSNAASEATGLESIWWYTILDKYLK